MINIKRTLIIFGQKTAAEVHSAAKLGFHDHFDTIRTFVFNEELSENTDFNSVMNAGGDVFFIAATIDFQLKPRVIQFAESLGLKPFSIIHPSAFIDESAEICEGVFVGPQAVVSANARIGNHSIIHIHSSIGHDSQIGEYCAILPARTRLIKPVRGRRHPERSRSFLDPSESYCLGDWQQSNKAKNR
ncbi:hypothetical protein OAK98_05405 [Mariniblastus sp.]|nr:hypothetical protein [Mariniblastus sp.]